jgi:hypothetical protein
MKMTIRKIKQLIRESMGKCPKCGKSTTNFGLYKAYPCDDCEGKNTTGDEELHKIAQDYNLFYSDDAYDDGFGNKMAGVVDSLTHKPVIFRNYIDNELYVLWDDSCDKSDKVDFYVPVDHQTGVHEDYVELGDEAHYANEVDKDIKDLFVLLHEVSQKSIARKP